MSLELQDPSAKEGGSQLPKNGRLFLWFALPLGLFAIMVGFLWQGLGRNPAELPSAMVGRPVPQFLLPPVGGRGDGLATRDLVGQVSLVNVFASWCTACRAEHPLFMSLSRNRVVPVHGLNYKDRPADAVRWLAELGNPYRRTGADRDGRVAIEWGVYGVPETFVVDARGRIVYRHVGPITHDVLKRKILPLIIKLRRGEGGR